MPFAGGIILNYFNFIHALCGVPRLPASPRWARGASGEVAVDGGVLCGAFEVLALDEALDALFDDGQADGELELLEAGRDELGVLEALARLHDAHNGGVDEVDTVLLDLGLGGLLLGGCLAVPFGGNER